MIYNRSFTLNHRTLRWSWTNGSFLWRPSWYYTVSNRRQIDTILSTWNLVIVV